MVILKTAGCGYYFMLPSLWKGRQTETLLCIIQYSSKTIKSTSIKMMMKLNQQLKQFPS